MKWVKRIAGGLIGMVALAILALLGLGMRESSGRLQGAVEIDRSPAEVFAWLSQKDKLTRWVGWLVEVRETGPLQVGARRVWVMHDPNLGRPIEIVADVEAYEPPRRLSVHTAMAGGFDGNASYTVVDLGAGRTRLETDSRFQFHHWLARLMKPLVARAARRKMHEDLARLKALAEAEPRLAQAPASGS
jgi:uncharacterized protein YndB with AHSA1/START domain